MNLPLVINKKNNKSDLILSTIFHLRNGLFNKFSVQPVLAWLGLVTLDFKILTM